MALTWSAREHRDGVPGDVLHAHWGLGQGAMWWLHRAAVLHGSAGILWMRSTPANKVRGAVSPYGILVRECGRAVGLLLLILGAL